ncbi:MAG: ATP-binding cassette domain-containing protein [Chlamydiia bacterium]|nr:ATP-binding cassette domain-containing protein [Chlamydiia bacterium]
MIRVKDLKKSYNGTEVLKGLNLEIHEGETLVILGRSGVGKSVLLRQLIGIEKPDDGSIEIDGKVISELTGSSLYNAVKEMGMLFQASALFDSMTIEENTAFYLVEHGNPEDGRPLPKKEIHERVQEALSMVGLEGIEKALPSDLSGGMRKRAALARLIVYKPKIFLYDEPTTGLDPITAMQINDLIVFIQKKLHATSIVVTHDLCSTFHIANRIALHHEGKIAFISEKKEFSKINHPVIKEFLKNSVPEIHP